jgi:hypothetical protein
MIKSYSMGARIRPPGRWRAGLLAGSIIAAWLSSAAAVDLSPLAGISRNDQVGGLRLALTNGAQAAIGRLGVADGFFGNPEVRIPLPGKLQKAEKMLRMVGYGGQVDALVQSMNRAAEAAVPEAKTLLVNSIKTMSITDASAILTGGPDSATQYFRRTTSAKLTEKFLPIVRSTTSKLGATQRYNDLGGKLAQLGLVGKDETTVESYVTQKTLDGLFLMIAKEEAAIRQNPLGQSSRLLQKVFGAIKL